MDNSFFPRPLTRFCYVLILILLLASCRQKSSPAGPVYSSADNGDPKQTLLRFAVHPLHNPARLGRAYQPLMDYLNRRIPAARFELEASRDYASYEEKYTQGEPDILLPNPWQTISAVELGYKVIAMAGAPSDFKGIFIVRKDSAVKTPSDLKGNTVSYPAPTALAACIMPQFFLHSHGIDINKDIRNLYVGSQESSIMNVLIGKSAAGATWPPPWRAFQKDHPKEAALLAVAWETPPLINNSVMVKKDIPQEVAQKLRRELVMLHARPGGKAILSGMETARFFEADDRTYDPVKDYISRFEKEVRKVNP